MFNEKDTIHFSCTQCGKCCSKSPSMHFYDMLELADEFLFQTSHHAILESEKNPLEVTLSEHFQALGHTIVMPEDNINAKLYYFIDFSPLSLPTYNSCSKLEDNLCSIYGKRPSSCKLAPLTSNFDDTQQWRTLNYYKKNTVDSDWKCNFSEDQPIVSKDEKIHQPYQNSLYFQSVDSIRQVTDIYIDYLKMANNEYLTQHFKTVFYSYMKNQQIISDVLIPLQAMKHSGIVSEDLALSFIEKQIKFIEKELAYAVNLKKKNNLTTTRLYTKQKEVYLKAINNKIFDSINSAEFTLYGEEDVKKNPIFNFFTRF